MLDCEYDINGNKTFITKKNKSDVKLVYCIDCRKFVFKNHQCKPFQPVDLKVMEICNTGAIALKCGFCGHYDDVFNFSKTEINGNLPDDIFQCPKCQTAIKRYYENGVKHKKIVTIM